METRTVQFTGSRRGGKVAWDSMVPGIQDGPKIDIEWGKLLVELDKNHFLMLLTLSSLLGEYYSKRLDIA